MEDAFVSELNENGSHFIYSSLLGGATGANPDDTSFGITLGNSIALMPGCSDNCPAFVTGQTTTNDFAPTTGFAQPANGGTTDPYDAFVAAFDSAGSGLIYATYLGGQGGEDGYGIIGVVRGIDRDRKSGFGAEPAQVAGGNRISSRPR